jgi:hypothetical protein
MSTSTTTRSRRAPVLSDVTRAELELTRRDLLARIDRLHRSAAKAYRALDALNEVLGTAVVPDADR